jgi:NADH:ubiquinone oxidoreductase subunit 3 (subunit A)
MPEQYVPVLLAFAVAVAIGAAILALAALLGGRRAGAVKATAYESGVPLLDSARKRVSVLFFLVAIDFVVFDVEAAFLYPWVLVLRDGGWPLFGAVMAFVAMILVGYVYLWRSGGLDLYTRRRRGSRA